MGSKKTEVKSQVQAAGPEEEALRKYLLSLSQQFGGQFGDLSSLANGTGLQLNAQDQALIGQAVNPQYEAGLAQLQDQFAGMNADVANNLSGTGQSDSSIEMVKRIMASGSQANALKDLAGQRASKAAEFGMQLPFQRAQTQLGANAQILAQMGVSSPALQSFLQERLGNSTQTQTQSGFSFADLAPMFSVTKAV